MSRSGSLDGTGRIREDDPAGILSSRSPDAAGPILPVFDGRKKVRYFTPWPYTMSCFESM
jgi:hypothetical protein